MEITAEGIAEIQKGSLPDELGIEPLEVSEGVARGRLIVERRHLHPFGYVHGGAWVTLADTVAAWATMRHLPPNTAFSTIELKTNVFAAARQGDELVATATPLHTGRRTHVWEVRIQREDRLMAVFTCTQMILSGEGSRIGAHIGRWCPPVVATSGLLCRSEGVGGAWWCEAAVGSVAAA